MKQKDVLEWVKNTWFAWFQVMAKFLRGYKSICSWLEMSRNCTGLGKAENRSRVRQQSPRPNQQQQRWSKQNMHLQHQTNMIPEHHPHHKQPWRRTSIHKHHSWEQQASNQQDTATSQIHHKWKEHQITGSGKEDCGNESTSYHATLSTDQRQQMEDHHPMI